MCCAFLFLHLVVATCKLGRRPIWEFISLRPGICSCLCAAAARKGKMDSPPSSASSSSMSRSTAARIPGPPSTPQPYFGPVIPPRAVLRRIQAFPPSFAAPRTFSRCGERPSELNPRRGEAWPPKWSSHRRVREPCHVAYGCASTFLGRQSVCSVSVRIAKREASSPAAGDSLALARLSDGGGAVAAGTSNLKPQKRMPYEAVNSTCGSCRIFRRLRS
jgi:hypothetical protein